MQATVHRYVRPDVTEAVCNGCLIQVGPSRSALIQFDKWTVNVPLLLMKSTKPRIIQIKRHRVLQVRDVLELLSVYSKPRPASQPRVWQVLFSPINVKRNYMITTDLSVTHFKWMQLPQPHRLSIIQSALVPWAVTNRENVIDFIFMTES